MAGGKYTTYRVMAKDAVDTAARGKTRTWRRQPPISPPWSAPMDTRRCGTPDTTLADQSGLHVARIGHLLHRHGTRTPELLALVADRPELAEPLPGADDYLAVEALYATSHEGALHVDDVLARRTRISIESWDRGEAAAEPVARLMAEVLNWPDETVKREVEIYHARVAAERESQRQEDDRTADSVRLTAPDALAGVQGDGAANGPT